MVLWDGGEVLVEGTGVSGRYEQLCAPYIELRARSISVVHYSTNCSFLFNFSSVQHDPLARPFGIAGFSDTFSEIYCSSVPTVLIMSGLAKSRLVQSPKSYGYRWFEYRLSFFSLSQTIRFGRH